MSCLYVVIIFVPIELGCVVQYVSGCVQAWACKMCTLFLSVIFFFFFCSIFKVCVWFIHVFAGCPLCRKKVVPRYLAHVLIACFQCGIWMARLYGGMRLTAPQAYLTASVAHLVAGSIQKVVSVAHGYFSDTTTAGFFSVAYLNKLTWVAYLTAGLSRSYTSLQVIPLCWYQ